MLSPCSLPSLKGLADTLFSEARAGQVVLFSFPSRRAWDIWRDSFLQALGECLRDAGEDRPEVFRPDIDGGASPEQALADFLDLPNASWENLLTWALNGVPIVVELFCEGKLDASWEQFVKDAARYFRVSETGYRYRFLCLCLVEPGQYPPVRSSPGLRNYAFWNPLKWEEIRLLVADSVGEKENPLTSAWRISTYAGAAGADPELVACFAKNQPASLAEVKSLINAYRSETNAKPVSTSKLGRFYQESRWVVPAGLAPLWSEGALNGATLDRGASLAWHRLPDDDVEPAFNMCVWREQLAGLFPLLLEITYFTAEAVSRDCGESWRRYLNGENGTRSTAEPGEILRIFREHRELGKLPQSIYELLRDLKRSRNKLAHLELLDLRDVERIYSRFKQVSRRA